ASPVVGDDPQPTCLAIPGLDHGKTASLLHAAGPECLAVVLAPLGRVECEIAVALSPIETLARNEPAAVQHDLDGIDGVGAGEFAVQGSDDLGIKLQLRSIEPLRHLYNSPTTMF